MIKQKIKVHYYQLNTGNMKSNKISTLVLSLILITSTSMASSNVNKDGKIKSDDKIETTKQEIFDNVIESIDNTADIVVMEAINNPVSSIPMDTRNSILDKLTYPDFAQDDQRNDVVVLSFTYTEDGFLKILSLNSSDEKLNPYIISKLEKIRLKNGSVTIGKEYYARFQFKLL